MNIFIEKMKSKSTKELVEILNQKDKYQKDAIIATVLELKQRDYNEQPLDEESIGVKLIETPESLFDKIKPFGYQVEKLEENLIIIKRKILFGMEVFRFEKDRISIRKKALFTNEILEYKRADIKDFAVDFDSNIFSPGQRGLIRYEPMSICLITLNGDFIKIIKLPVLNEHIDETKELFEKIIKILRMNN